MATLTATPGNRLRLVLRGVLLTAALVVGLLAMHTLDLHGTSAAHASGVSTVSKSVVADVHEHGLPESEPAVAGEGGVDRGLAGHAGVAAACVLALLLAFLLLVPPRLLPRWFQSRQRFRSRAGAAPRRILSPPSLQQLCVSRT